MIKNYIYKNEQELETLKSELIFNSNSFSNEKIHTLTTKNNTFNFKFYNNLNFRLPDGYYDKPYPDAVVYAERTFAPITPYQIEYNTNTFNYLNSYSLTLLNETQIGPFNLDDINTVYYGDILVHHNTQYLVYGFEIDYLNSITETATTTINGSGFALNPQGDRYNTQSVGIYYYNPLFFYNNNALNDYYYYNKTLNKQVLASPYVNSNPELGSYEINTNYAYYKDFINANGTISFNPNPIIKLNTNSYAYDFKFTNLIDYYVGKNTNVSFNYNFGFIAANMEDAVNTENGTEYNYFYNYTNIIKEQTFTTYSKILEFQSNIQEPNNNVYLNTTSNVPLMGQSYIYNPTVPNFNPLTMQNKLVSTNNMQLRLKVINMTELFDHNEINGNMIFTNMQNINIMGVSFGVLLSAILTFTVIVSLLKLGRK